MAEDTRHQKVPEAVVSICMNPSSNYRSYNLNNEVNQALANNGSKKALSIYNVKMLLAFYMPSIGEMQPLPRKDRGIMITSIYNTIFNNIKVRLARLKKPKGPYLAPGP